MRSRRVAPVLPVVVLGGVAALVVLGGGLALFFGPGDPGPFLFPSAQHAPDRAGIALHPTPAPDPTRSPADAAGPAEPVAVSFVSADVGWALGPGGCAGCGVLSATTDGGAHWTQVSTVPSLPAQSFGLAFADAEHGLLYAEDPHADCTSCLVETADGGQTWTPEPLPPVTQVVSGNDTSAGGAAAFYALTDSADQPSELYREGPTGAWTPVPLPTDAVEQVAASGDSLALLGSSTSGGDALWTSGDDGARWTPHALPCPTDFAAGVVSLALGHPSALLLDCIDDPGADGAARAAHEVFGSDDLGGHWTRLADPPIGGDPSMLADNGSGHAFLAVETAGQNYLRSTTDGGLSWHTSITNEDGFFGWAGLRFVSPDVGFVLGLTHDHPEVLYRTLDAGATWQPVPLP